MTDTMSSTPEPSRPQPGALPSRQRFTLPDQQPGAARPAATRLGAGPNTAARGNPPDSPFTARSSASGPQRNAAPSGAAPPDGRYGERRGMSRPRKIGLGIAGLAILGGVASYIGWEMSHPAVQGTVTSFNAASSTSLLVTFEVDKPADKSATCTLVAVNGHGAVVGTASVPILSGRAKNVQTFALQTTTTANTVTVESCKLTS